MSSKGQLGVAIAISMIMMGCCSNVFTLEMIVNHDAGAGHVVTFVQFAFVALEGVTSALTWNNGIPSLPKRHIPMTSYLVIVSMFFGLSVLNNKALDYDIPLPLHMIFRSGSLIANIALGYVILGRRVTAQQMLAVVLVTIGITAATAAQTSLDKPDGTAGAFDSSAEDWMTTLKTLADSALTSLSEGGTRMWTGIVMLMTALLMSAGLGIMQERAYAKVGKQWKEMMLYSHLLALPGFLFLWDDISSRLRSYGESEPLENLAGIPVLEGVPSMYIYLIGNVATQYICVRGVYTLTGLTNSLTMTLVISLRKFVSLVISVFYFGHVFQPAHWFGTAAVFTGTLLYALGGKKKAPAADTDVKKSSKAKKVD